MATNAAIVEVFCQAYQTLQPSDRQQLAERILRDRKLLEDLADHMLIERAKLLRGKPVPLSGHTASES